LGSAEAYANEHLDETQPVRTLIYKRTHNSDPDASGQFGICDCLGRVRRWDFDAVVGVGGLSPEARLNKLDGKVNWIGIGAHRQVVAGKRGPIVTFDHFEFYGSDGPDFKRLAPVLAERIYSRNVRVLMNGLSSTEQREVERILRRARNAPPSPCRQPAKNGERKACVPRKADAVLQKPLKGCLR
jgi:hypothetical protein